VFGRSKAPAAPEEAAAQASEAKEGGKGRPTPKRREAEKGRRRAAVAPKTRKEAYRSMRERQREDRTHQMAALKAGDERNLPPRDRGPVRRYVRDVVDARRTVAEFFLPFALLILALTFTSNTQLRTFGSALWLTLVALIIVDSLVLIRRLRSGIRRNFPDQPSKGVVPYALMRSMQIRRFRLPPPRLKAGRRRNAG
jgi:hypothetical protein